MLRIELLERQESLFHWIKTPANKQNPNLKGIIKYWLRLTALIHNVDFDATEIDDKQPPIEEELGTPEGVMDMPVIDPILL
ncbi:hypothetical protein [Maribacter sp. ACAM166]|uniref:hypothetical protein n=1 Tax=Maribacter sp. ACAM166 TaxID=2508996 RepID=UPI0014857684|nr:hypothetical protein [Maribacter sp. ACAM166]